MDTNRPSCSKSEDCGLGPSPAKKSRSSLTTTLNAADEAHASTMDNYRQIEQVSSTEAISEQNEAGEASADDDNLSMNNSDINEQNRFVGPRNPLDETKREIVRMICQHFKDIGLDQSADAILRESGCYLNHPSADQFRKHIMAGEWNEAVYVLNELTAFMINKNQSLVEMKFLIFEQKYLELLDRGLTLEAIQVLRKELTPLAHNAERIHQLSVLVLYNDRDKLQARAKWSGAGPATRATLMEKLRKHLPHSVMLPPNCLESLLCKGSEMEMQHTYHISTTKGTFIRNSPAVDHTCGKDHLPCHTSQRLYDHSDEIWCCQFSPDGLKLATGSKDMTVIIWDVDPTTLRVTYRKTLDGHTHGVACINWSPNSNHLIACGPEDCSELWVWRVGTPDCELRMKFVNSTDDSLTACAWHRDGIKFVTGGIRGQFYECDIDGNILNSWQGVQVKCLWWRDDGETVLVADSQHRIRSYNTNNQSDFTIIQEDHPIISLRTDSVDRMALINLANHQSIHLWDLQSRCIVKRFQRATHGYFTNHSCFGGKNKNFIVSGSDDNNVYLWHVKREFPVAILIGHKGAVNSVSWNPVYHQMIASVSDDCTVRIWGPMCSSLDKTDNVKIRD